MGKYNAQVSLSRVHKPIPAQIRSPHTFGHWQLVRVIVYASASEGMFLHCMDRSQGRILGVRFDIAVILPS